MTGGGSVVVRRQLGAKLRRLRQRAGKSHADIAEAGLGSRAKINRIENGRLPVKVGDVIGLCWLYGADQATTDALTAMAPGTHQEGWWEEYGEAVVPDWFGLLTGLETAASRIRAFEPETVHGLVQTPEYAALVIGADDPRVSPDVVEQRVRFRQERQKAVLETKPEPIVTLVLSECALLFGPPDIMEPQIEYLRSVSSRPNVDVLVLPFSARTYPRRGAFTLLDFDDDEDPSVVYVEVPPSGARYLDREEERTAYEVTFDIITQKSIPVASVPIERWKR